MLDSKLEQINKELCETIGIEPKEFCERTSDLCFKNCPVYANRENPDYCFKYKKLLPKLYQPDNFVKLIETNILTGATMMGFLSLKGIYMSNRYNFLLSLNLFLKMTDEKTRENIKKNLKKQIWYYE